MNKEKDIYVVEDMEPDILETVRIECPKCHSELKANAEDKDDLICFCCDRRIRVRDRAGELKGQEIQETLRLPKGSVRAFVALILSATCWIMIFKEETVPYFLFNLLVAVISYYFAFRKKESVLGPSVKSKPDEFSDVTESGKAKPLYLPAGFIRYILICGFFIAAVVGAKNHCFDNPHYREFFVILSGLVLGYFFAKFANMFKKDIALYNHITHLKGVLVLIAALGIAVVMLTGVGNSSAIVIFSCLITFYFGSKS